MPNENALLVRRWQSRSGKYRLIAAPQRSRSEPFRIGNRPSVGASWTSPSGAALVEISATIIFAQVYRHKLRTTGIVAISLLRDCYTRVLQPCDSRSRLIDQRFNDDGCYPGAFHIECVGSARR
jgi:hypothetical protein